MIFTLICGGFISGLVCGWILGFDFELLLLLGISVLLCSYLLVNGLRVGCVDGCFRCLCLLWIV